MALQLPTPTGLSPSVEAAFDEVIAPLQSFVNRELSGVWVSLARGDLNVQADAGVTVTITDNLTIATKPGWFKIATQGSLAVVSFNIGVTLSAVSGQIDFLFPMLVVGRAHNVAYDSGGISLSATLGTAEDVLGLTADGYDQIAALHLEKLSGADFAASSYALIGQVQGEAVLR